VTHPETSEQCLKPLKQERDKL